MSALLSSFDWAATPLGAPVRWPASLKTIVGTLLRSPIAMILLWGEDGHMIYNAAYAVVAGDRHPAILGAKVREGWPEVAAFNDRVMRVGLAGDTLSFRDQEMVLIRSGKPETVWFNLDYSPVLDEDGQPGGVLAIVMETTQRVLSERRVVGESERLRAMFAQAPSFMAVLTGPEHRFEIVNESYRQLIGHRTDVIGKTVREALPEIEGQGFFELLDQVLATGIPFVGRAMPVDIQRHPDGPTEKRYLDLVYQPITDSEGHRTGIFAEGYDVTDRVVSEEHQRLLLREMNHRVKNLFAIVSGMVGVTARTAPTPRDMARTLKGRLEALAVANDLIRPGLIGDHGDDATTDLETLVRTVLKPHMNADTRLAVDGPEVAVGNRSLTSLALFLHELATNASKHGALSVPDGVVTVTWSSGADRLLTFDWVERGGPAATEPAEVTGFGTVLARRSIEGQLQGRLAYDWDPRGLSIRASVPLEPATA